MRSITCMLFMVGGLWFADNVSYEFDIPGLAQTEHAIAVLDQEITEVPFRSAIPSMIQSWLDTTVQISATDRQRLNQVADVKRQIDANHQNVERLQAARQEYSTEQERIANLQVLTPDSRAAQPFLDRLNDAEAKIGEIDQHLIAARQQAAELTARFDQLAAE